LFTTAVGVVYSIPFTLIWFDNPQALLLLDGEAATFGLLPSILLIIAGFIVHEFIHAFFYAPYAKNGFKSVKIGVVLKKGYAYCDCREIMRSNKFIVGLVMPMIILGIIPSVVSMFIGNMTLLIFGILFTGAGAGDVLILAKIFKDRKRTWFENLPSISKWYVYKPIKDKG
jgi:hypothetical protein